MRDTICGCYGAERFVLLYHRYTTVGHSEVEMPMKGAWPWTPVPIT